jgi:hypothetical protein
MVSHRWRVVLLGIFVTRAAWADGGRRVNATAKAAEKNRAFLRIALKTFKPLCRMVIIGIFGEFDLLAGKTPLPEILTV